MTFQTRRPFFEKPEQMSGDKRFGQTTEQTERTLEFDEVAHKGFCRGNPLEAVRVSELLEWPARLFIHKTKRRLEPGEVSG